MMMTQFNCHVIITHNTLSTNSSTHLLNFESLRRVIMTKYININIDYLEDNII